MCGDGKGRQEMFGNAKQLDREYCGPALGDGLILGFHLQDKRDIYLASHELFPAVVAKSCYRCCLRLTKPNDEKSCPLPAPYRTILS